MAKLKIRKLVKDLEQAHRRMDNLIAMLAVSTHKNGGNLVFTKEELSSVPDAQFGIKTEDGGFNLFLTYKEPA